MRELFDDPPDPAQDGDVRGFVRAAAAVTTPPAAFDLARVMDGARRRRSRRRRAMLAGTTAVAAAAAAIAAASTLGSTSSAPLPVHISSPSARTTSTNSPTRASTRQPTEAAKLRRSSPAARLNRLLTGSATLVTQLQSAGSQRGAATLSGSCETETCDSAILTTDDGWRTNRVHLVPDATYVWIQLLADGSVAFVPAGITPPGILLPDGRLIGLAVSSLPADVTRTSVLTSAPPQPLFDRGVWVLDRAAGTLRPLRSAPRDRIVWGAPQVADDGSVVVDMSPPHISPPVTVTVARTRDGGRTWTYSRVTGDSPRVGMPGTLAVGPHGRMALSFSADGATLAPLVELWTSTDSGRTWARMRPHNSPPTTDGMAYAPDGTLLLASNEVSGLWRATSDGTDLERSTLLPRTGSLTSSGGVLVAQLGIRSFAFSLDGKSWRKVTLPAPLR